MCPLSNNSKNDSSIDGNNDTQNLGGGTWVKTDKSPTLTLLLET